MIIRSSKKYIDNQIEQNPNWKVLDIGCGYTAHKKANIICDVQDLSEYYKGRDFVKLEDKTLPFKDKEFDFVITSHVIEHVEDVNFFIKELQRISTKGYIELPSRLADNLVFENQKDHIWWFSFNDIDKFLIASKRNQLIEPFINVSTAKFFEEIFRESLVIELIWENKIEYKIDNSLRHEEIKKTSFLKLIKKYLSKKIRNLIR